MNENEINDCLKVLGFTNHRFSGEVDFETAESHYDKITTVCFSRVNNTTILIYNKIEANTIRNSGLIPAENIRSKKYLNLEFLSMFNFEGTNSYLYHYFAKDKTKRLKQGTYPEVIFDIGDELPKEKNAI